MILIPNWDIEKSFFLDQMRRHEKTISYEASSSEGLKRGSGFNVDTKTLVVWIIASDIKKPKIMDIQETTQAKIIVWILDNTFGK